MIDGLSRELADWQNKAYAKRYHSRVAQIRAVEQKVDPGSEALTRAFALGYYKLLAYKDEYESRAALCPARIPRGNRGEFRGRATSDLPFRAAAS